DTSTMSNCTNTENSIYCSVNLAFGNFTHSSCFVSRNKQQLGIYERSTDMRPKKRDRNDRQEAKEQFESANSDHELFLQAFEKPTQIYRYLRNRSIVSPIFLHRTLSYMRKRMSRSHRSRAGFRINDILQGVEGSMVPLKTSQPADSLCVKFTGFIDKENLIEDDQITLEVILLRMPLKKRKQDVPESEERIVLGQVEVGVNPPAGAPSSKICVPPKLLAPTSKSPLSTLLLRTCNKKQEALTERDNMAEPVPVKRTKIGKYWYENYNPVYGGELMVFDKSNMIVLTEGEYELSLCDVGLKTSQIMHSAWENVPHIKDISPATSFLKSPVLKMNITWIPSVPIIPPKPPSKPTTKQQSISPSKAPSISPSKPAILPTSNVTTDITSTTDLKSTIIPTIPPSIQPQVKQEISTEMMPTLSDSLSNSLCTKGIDAKEGHVLKKSSRVFYNFIYNNGTQHQTESYDNVHCPWCLINCMQLYSLLKHLRLNHARFNFVYSPHAKGAKIDVSVNECYDGSYDGNPQDVHSHHGYAFSRDGPARRTEITQVLVNRPKKLLWSLTEFLEQDEADIYDNIQYVQGHNRLYYHTVGTQPLWPEEIEVDSEEENDPLWMRQKTVNLIEEFSDVNEGEKEVMKMWNHHAMHNNYVGDCEMGQACVDFAEKFKEELERKKLKRNLLLHFVNLFDFGLIQPDIVYKAMAVLD
ncbi:unnamed protein product, partial [Owenia fusiformis]